MPTPKTVLALRHLAFEDLGLLRPVLEARGFERFITLDAGVDDLRAVDLDGVDLLVVLGGPIGAYDDALYPYLNDELALIRRRLAARRPLLGICLGAQLMARALGADVRPMAHGRKEIGFAPLTLTDAGRASALAPLADGQPVLHWHGDQFDLPAGAPTLATTPSCPHQAFAIEGFALALQFHLECDPTRLEQWLIGHAGELAQAGVPLDALRRDAATHGAGLRAALGDVVDRWMAGWAEGA
ncbi:glutamine amidotransferase [Mitsuaria sp. GD03876]|uniref:glutamine amidotransferase n=1 Tax=Mitsuaria sp. GD03876 TaxID=2975399 RepID=UPI00244D11F7|nr:glutamine amidotransferase [Mitsuaria sp. GD03876]MDH0863904.1 glutamine amidotransferase [Mitsuaria sp. GD03876]